MIDKIESRLTPIIVLSLTLLILAVFWQVQNHEFINMDDYGYITENSNVRGGLSLENITWAFTSTHSFNWHPLTWLSHMIDCHLYGLNPKGHHFNNLLFHVANTLLLFLILKKMTNAIWRSAFVAALFALHPLHVESVAWIAERKDVLSTFLLMLSLWAYNRYVERPGINRYLLVLLFFAMGLMSKPMLVTLPCVLLLLDYWPLRRLKIRNRKYTNQTQACESIPNVPQFSALRLVIEKVPLLLLSTTSSIVTYLVQKSWGAVPSFEILPLKIRITNALVSYVGYMGKMIWPHNLAVYYPHSGATVSMWKTIGSSLLLIFVSIAVIRAARAHAHLMVGWFWYLGTLVPVIGLIQVGSQAMADRYTYVPLIGLFIIIAWSIPSLIGKWRYRKIALTISSGLVISYLTVCTSIQLRYWKNSTALFEHALEVTSNNNMVHYYLGVVLDREGKYPEAIAHYTSSLRINPHHELARNNLGVVLTKQGRLDEAIAHYKEILRINPNNEKTHNNLGIAFAKQGKFELAITHHAEAIRIKPDFFIAHNNLGLVLAQMGKFEEARKHFLESLKIEPDYAETHYFLGSVYSSMGDSASASKEYEILKSLDPNLANRLSIMISK